MAQLIPRMIETAADFSWQHLSMTLNGFACKLLLLLLLLLIMMLLLLLLMLLLLMALGVMFAEPLLLC